MVSLPPLSSSHHWPFFVLFDFSSDFLDFVLFVFLLFSVCIHRGVTTLRTACFDHSQCLKISARGISRLYPLRVEKSCLYFLQQRTVYMQSYWHGLQTNVFRPLHSHTHFIPSWNLVAQGIPSPSNGVLLLFRPSQMTFRPKRVF